MAKLPQSIEMQGPRGGNPSGAAVNFDGLDQALQGAAREVQRYDETRKAADDEQAGRVLDEVQQAYMPEAAVRAAEYDGRNPGFAAAEGQQIDALIAPVLAREDLPDGVRDSTARQARMLKTRLLSQAIGVEAQTRSRRTAADRDAAEQASAVRSVMDIQTAFDAIEDEQRQTAGPETPGFAAGLVGKWRALSEQSLEGMAPGVAERVRPMLLSHEARLQATAMAQEDEARDASTLRTVGTAMQALANRARRDPALAARYNEEVEPILQAAPAFLRDRLRTEGRSLVVTNALTTRIEGGEFEAVKTEIDAGTYDWMDGRTLESLRSGIETAAAVRTVEDATAEADLAAAIDTDLMTILSGGAGDATLAARAETVGGPDVAARVRIDQAAARQVQPLMARLRTLTPQEASAELARLQAAGGDAVGARTLELASGLIQRDQALRGTNPAGWAATEIGPGDRVAAEVKARMQAFEAAPSPETAQAYATATWKAQEAGGIDRLQRRILDTGAAERWIAALDADGAPATALVDLSQRVALFGGYRAQVLRELGLSGMKPADLGAMTHYAGSPARMAQYARGRAMRPNDAVADKDTRDEIEVGLRRILVDYNRTLASGDGALATMEAARTLAYGLVAQGESVDSAMQTATAPIVDRWDFQGTWAIPTDQGLNTRWVRINAQALVDGLVARGGAGLAAPPSSSGMTPEQSRRNYRDRVRNGARLRTLANGQGVELVLPARDGSGWVRVKDAADRDVTRTFQQLNQPATDGPSGRFGFN